MFLVSALLYSSAALLRIWMATTVRWVSVSKKKDPQELSLGSLKKSIRTMLTMILGGGVLTWIFITDGVRDIAFRLSGELQPLYLKDVGGITVEQIGILGAIFSIAMMFTPILSGKMADKHGERVPIALGFLLALVAVLFFSVRLVGSVMSPGYPEWSFAAIAGTGAGKTMLYREGSTVDGSRVLAVHPSSVVMTSGGGACQLLMFEEEEAQVARGPAFSVPVASPSAKPADPRSAGLTEEELSDGIEKISDTQFKIQRSIVDKVLANQGSLMKAARVIPHEEDGRVVGVRLYGIRRTSLLGRLGIRNGDMLRTINGFDMTSPDSALEAYTTLRSADKLTLALKRKNKDMTIDYNIE
jgi:type II secretory pathway component PulC